MRGAILLAALTLTGCNQSKAQPDPELALMKSRLDGLEQRIDRAEADVSGIQRPAFLKLSGSGFDFVNSDLGRLSLQLKSLTAEGAGTRVKLEVGNPTTAAITDMAFYGFWGSLDKDGDPSGESHGLGGIKVKQHVQPGVWQPVTFIIDGAKPSDIGYVKVTAVAVNSMTLKAP